MRLLEGKLNLLYLGQSIVAAGLVIERAMQMLGTLLTGYTINLPSRLRHHPLDQATGWLMCLLPCIFNCADTIERNDSWLKTKKAQQELGFFSRPRRAQVKLRPQGQCHHCNGKLLPGQIKSLPSTSRASHLSEDNDYAPSNDPLRMQK